MSEVATDLAKVARTTLASHFSKEAAHHEKMAAQHGEMHKAYSGRLEALKEDKSAHAFHKIMSASHEKCMKAHATHADHLREMAEAHTDVADPAMKALFESFKDEALSRLKNSGEFKKTGTHDITDTGL